MILNWSVTLYGPASVFRPLAFAVVGAGLWGMFVVIISWLDLDAFPGLARWETQFGWLNAVVVVALIGGWTYIQFHNSPGYTTDELSFDQYAAQLVAHGLNNPYVHTMAPAGPLFRLSPDGYTYTTSGSPVLAMSYPALSFLVYVPFILLGWTNEVGSGLNVLAWVVSVLLMFWLLPPKLRPAVLLLSSIDVYLAFAAGGVTDMLYIPLLIIAAYRWDRFATSRLSYIGPVAMGLAMAIKQTPWPVLAFVLCALAMDEYDRNGQVQSALRRAGRYLAVAVAAFLIPNLPYLIASPSAWFSGVFQPFTAQMVPTGQGLISLTLFAHLGGGSLAAWTAIMVLVAVLVFVAYLGTYPLLRPATFMLASFVYFFAARSQTNYLVFFIPVALVAAVTAGPPAAIQNSRLATGLLGVARGRNWAAAIAGVAALAAATIIYAFTSTSPLTVTITGQRTSGYLGTIKTLIVSVKNNTGKALRPSYTVQTSHGYTTFWPVWLGAKTIPAHATRSLQLIAPNYPAEPGLVDGFSVVAFTHSPEAVSVSHRFLLNLLRTATIPQAFDTAQPLHRRIRLRIEILDHFNSNVRRAGIKVYLSQLLYTSLGVRTASARIYGAKVSKAVGAGTYAYTNSAGVATFYIVGTRPSRTPITFSAHLKDKPAKYVYASSGYINIRFKK